MKIEILIPAYTDNNDVAGWYIYDLKKNEIVAGPYDSHEDCFQMIEIRLYRIKQGWKP